MAVLFGDTFVDTNGVLITAHTPTGANAGLSWSRSPFATTDLFIQGNGVCDANSTFVDTHAVFNQSGTWPADVSIAFDAHYFTAVNFIAVTARHATATDGCYAAAYDGTGGGSWTIEKFSTANPGVSSAIASFVYAMPVNGTIDHMIFEVQGNALRLYKNSVLIIATTDSTYASAGKPGIYDLSGSVLTATTGIHIEAMVVSDLVTGKTFFLNNPIQGGSNAGLLDTVAPTASTITTGWTVGATAINQYSRSTYNQEVPTTGFTSTAQPSSAPVNLGEDCFRISGVTTGQFSAGTWYSSVSVIAVTSGGIQQGRGRFRLWASASADGTAARELTQGTMIGSQVTELNTTVAQTSSASTQIAASNLTNEFLFQQLAWETL